MIRPLLGMSTLLFHGLDCLTTYLAMTSELVQEANPLADFLFRAVGLGPAFAFNLSLTLLVVLYLVYSTAVPRSVSIALLGLMALIPAVAVVNNLTVLKVLGLL